MAAPSMHICMDSDYWLKGIVPEEAGMGSSSPSAELITCPRPMQPSADRRLRPQHDQPLKCPRCDSTHTKFCYYNNYSLSQPRYFCKTCRRYWTKGGSLRNVPVGGGCRKNKRTSSKKPAAAPPPHRHTETGLHLSFSGMQMPPPAADALCGLSLVDWKYDPILAGPAGAALENADSEAHFSGGGMMGIADGGYHALNALRYTVGGGEHLALPFGAHMEHDAAELKPAAERLLSLEWCGEASRPPESCLNGLGLWTGMIGGGHHHGSSTAI